MFYQGTGKKTAADWRPMSNKFMAALWAADVTNSTEQIREFFFVHLMITNRIVSATRLFTRCV